MLLAQASESRTQQIPKTLRLFHLMVKFGPLHASPWEHTEGSGKQKVLNGGERACSWFLLEAQWVEGTWLDTETVLSLCLVYHGWFLGPPVRRQ